MKLLVFAQELVKYKVRLQLNLIGKFVFLKEYSTVISTRIEKFLQNRSLQSKFMLD